MVGIVAVTGGIGAGKSTVLEILSQTGRRTLDSDLVVHSFYASGHPVNDRLVTRWGPGICDGDGTICREKVAERVFGSPDELAWLNSVVHPEVRKAILHEAASGDGLLFCAIPLLFEAGWQGDMVATWAVWCDPVTQKERLQARGWSREQIELRLQRQISMDDKLRLADAGLINTGSRRMLAVQVVHLLNRATYQC